jgi:ABC-type lipoprotein release transport system permease subunit
VGGTFWAYVIDALNIPIVVPGASVPLQIKIDLVFSAYAEAVALAWGLAIVATLIPAIRASRMNIVDALRRFI